MCSICSAVSGEVIAVVEEYEGKSAVGAVGGSTDWSGPDFGKGCCPTMGSAPFQITRCLPLNQRSPTDSGPILAGWHEEKDSEVKSCSKTLVARCSEP